MKSKLFHQVWHIKNYAVNSPLYKKFFTYLEIPIWNEGADYFAVDVNGFAIWLVPTTDQTKNDRDSYGMNHCAFIVDTKADVDRFTAEFLQPNGVETLFGTPKEREEFHTDATGYYQVMFQLPGDILFEVLSEEK